MLHSFFFTCYFALLQPFNKASNSYQEWQGLTCSFNKNDVFKIQAVQPKSGKWVLLSPAHTADAASQSSTSLLHLFLSGVLSLDLQPSKSLLPPFSSFYLLSNLQAINLSPGIRAALPSPSWDTSMTSRGYESRGAL